jgi:FkbM family methyltransferase
MRTTFQRINIAIQVCLNNLMIKHYTNGLNDQKIAIDCGANVGNITCKLAATGAKVYAFEPNPYAYAKLVERVGHFDNVECINKGVWDKNSSMKLYCHEMAKNDDVFWSFGSSIVESKENIDPKRGIDVEVIDLVEFISHLNAEIEVLKIDIEGAECELLEKFIHHGLHKKVKFTLVETHDRKIPGQKAKTDVVRKLIKQHKISNIRLNWL